MLESKQRNNAGQINSGSTAKCLKTQAFYPQVNSCQSRLGICLELTGAIYVCAAELISFAPVGLSGSQGRWVGQNRKKDSACPLKRPR